MKFKIGDKVVAQRCRLIKDGAVGIIKHAFPQDERGNPEMYSVFGVMVHPYEIVLETPINQTAYERDGFENREEYLDNLKDNYDPDMVDLLSDLLGDNEDYDGLLSELEDYDMLYG